MAYGRNKFTDPQTGVSYSWAINHSEEEEAAASRDVKATATTDGEHFVFTGSAEKPMRFVYSGTILQAAQFAQMRRFYELSKTRTIIFEDFAGDEYEVIITAFKPTRHRTARNPRDATIELHYWSYTIEMQVVAVLAGAWLDS